MAGTLTGTRDTIYLNYDFTSKCFGMFGFSMRTAEQLSHASTEVFAQECVQQWIDCRIKIRNQKRQWRQEGIEIWSAIITVRPVCGMWNRLSDEFQLAVGLILVSVEYTYQYWYILRACSGKLVNVNESTTMTSIRMTPRRANSTLFDEIW